MTKPYRTLAMALVSLAIGVAVSFAPTIAVAGIIAVSIVLALVWRPEVGLAVFLTSMFVWTLLPANLYDRLGGYFYLITAGLVSGVMVLRYRVRLERLDGLGFSLVAFTAYLFVAILWSDAPSFGLFKATAFLFGSVVLYFLVLWVYRERANSLWYLAIAVALLGLVPVALTVISALNTGFTVSMRTERVYYLGTVMGFDTYGLTNSLQVAAICVVALALRKQTVLVRFIWLAVFALEFWALLALSQRAQILGVVLASALLVAASGLQGGRRLRGKSLSRLVLAAAVMIGLVAIAFQGASKLAPQFLSSDENITTRLELYEIALGEFRNEPVLGTGTGAFSTSAFGVDARIFAHNIILDILAESGLVGLFLFLGIVYSLLVYAFRLTRAKAYSSLGWLGLAVAASRLIVGMFSADLSTLNLGPWLAMLAIAAAVHKPLLTPSVKGQMHSKNAQQYGAVRDGQLL